MTDWDLMIETIQRAMEVVDKAHAASNELRKNTTPETLDRFRGQLAELTSPSCKRCSTTRKPSPSMKWQTG